MISAGNVEVIGMRDRLTQTLYLSDVFLVNDPRYPYFQLHTGLYVSAIRDAQDRAESIVLREEIPDTWYLRSGLDSDQIMDLSQPEFKVKKVGANIKIYEFTDQDSECNMQNIAGSGPQAVACNFACRA